ncbi:MAG: tetratricopeptide repeat protein [Bryobacteraceae bacterium]
MLGLLSLILLAQTDTAYGLLAEAYERLKAKDYEGAVAGFRQAIALAPTRAALRKDLGYTLLKIGEQEAARDQFAEAMRLDPTDHHVALEYAFLCFETRQQREARRTFDRIRQGGNAQARATAQAAFDNIDRPLAEGITRWQQALAREPSSASGHEELARLAEQRDDAALASKHYERAWQLHPARRSLLLDLGRVWKELGQGDQAMAALLAASRGADARVAESARGLMPARYPFLYEFRNALALDPRNIELRRELAYLLLNMNQKQEAEAELRIILEHAPDDHAAAAQIGFFFLERQDVAGGRPFLDKALASDDEDLAAGVRAALKLPPALRHRPTEPASGGNARQLGDRSYDAGFLKDALRYYNSAHEANPTDFGVMLKLGWTHNMLKQDDKALRWFSLASRSPDGKVSTEASRAFRNLRPQFARVRTSVWMLPMYSSRWKDLFSYGQVRLETRLGRLPFRPYASVRFAGDARGTTGNLQPQYLSESSVIVGAGLATRSWRGLTAWGEAGSSVSYLGRRQDVGRAVPDYRGGLSFGRGFGRLLGAESSGAFAETHKDGVFVSRFQNTFLLYSQNRFGYTFASTGALRLQLCWNANVTADVKRLQWANYVETGPGIRFRWTTLPPSMFFAVDILRGAHTINTGNPRRPNFNDIRVGVWYAFTR